MKLHLTIVPGKPRNPYAVFGRQRKAGSHGPYGNARRQRLKHELRLELHRAAGDPPPI